MDPVSFLSILLIGALAGAFGQGLRAVVGLYKAHASEDFKFDLGRLLVSLVLGAFAGALSAMILMPAPVIVMETIFALVASGYAGTDFIESLINTKFKS